MAYIPRSVDGFNPYAVGNRIYGGGRPFPTIGPVDPMGYKERDLLTKSRRSAILRRMQANVKGNYASADALRVV